MSKLFRVSSLAWGAVWLGALGFLLWTNLLRIQRIEYVSGIGEPTTGLTDGAANTPTSSTGWQPRLIVPDQDNASFEWLDQTQLMLARREWRVRHIEYENAPFGHAIDSASPYRWWLGSLAWLDHATSGRPLPMAVERAALIADPLLHLIFLVATVGFVVWQFGAWPAAVLAAGMVAFFPFTAGFLPGAPSELGLARVCAFWSVLPLLAGIRVAHSVEADAGRRAERWFAAAGVIGGLGLWIAPVVQAPVVVGIALSGLGAAGIARRWKLATPAVAVRALPWLPWALAGAATCLAGYLIEYFPAHLGSWQLRGIHPLFGLAWLGGGGLLARSSALIQGERPQWRARVLGIWVLYAAAVAALPVAMWRTHSLGFLEADLPAFRLTRLPGDGVATDLLAWMIHEPDMAKIGASLLPVLLLLPVGWLLLRRGTGLAHRISLVVGLGPVLVAFGFACNRLSWLHQVDVLLLALMVAATAAVASSRSWFPRWLWSGLVAVFAGLGAVQIVPPADARTNGVLDPTEILGLVERDLARSLALHVGTGKGVVLAPHNQAITLYYYGGFPGLATLTRNNLDGLGAAVRIVSASTPEEAKELIDQRGVTHIIMPSWDEYLAEYTRMGMGKIDGTFYERLISWRLPPWLKPVPYQVPTVAGFEGNTVTILEVVEDQDDAVAISRIAEYFIEIGQTARVALAGQSLRRFPADLGALTARAQVELARNDRAGFDRTFESMVRRIAGGADRGLQWDRRVSLAVVLARNKREDLAREQVKRCLDEADEVKLRSLGTGSLYRLQVLGKAYRLSIPDLRLRQLALDLLPTDMRSHL